METSPGASPKGFRRRRAQSAGKRGCRGDLRCANYEVGWSRLSVGLGRGALISATPRYRPNSSAWKNVAMCQSLKSAQCLAGDAVRLTPSEDSTGRDFASLENGVNRRIDRCRSKEVRRSHESQGRGRQVLNLGMLSSTNEHRESTSVQWFYPFLLATP